MLLVHLSPAKLSFMLRAFCLPKDFPSGSKCVKKRELSLHQQQAENASLFCLCCPTKISRPKTQILHSHSYFPKHEIEFLWFVRLTYRVQISLGKKNLDTRQYNCLKNCRNFNRFKRFLNEIDIVTCKLILCKYGSF